MGYRKHPHQQYRKDHCHRMRDLVWDGMDLSFLTGEGNVARRHGARSKWNLALRICYRFIELVVDDIVATGNEWKLPVQQGARLRIVRMPEAEIRALTTKTRRYKRVNLFESDFNLYQFVLDFQRKGRTERLQVMIDHGTWCRMVDLVNAGMRYQETTL